MDKNKIDVKGIIAVISILIITLIIFIASKDNISTNSSDTETEDTSYSAETSSDDSSSESSDDNTPIPTDNNYDFSSEEETDTSSEGEGEDEYEDDEDDDDSKNDQRALDFSDFDSYWQYIETTYPHVTYDDISSGQYTDQYVLIDGIIDHIDRSLKISRLLDYDVYYKSKSGYQVSESDLAKYSDNIRYSEISQLKNGYKVRFCVYINSDNSFGGNLLSLKILSKKKGNIRKKIKNEYIKKCKSYPYKKIARNPKKYKGKKIKFTGEVLQTTEAEYDGFILRIAVDDDYDHVYYVLYEYKDGQDKFLEDDIVAVYGEIRGEETYTSVLGSDITLPKIEAKYIKLKK